MTLSQTAVLVKRGIIISTITLVLGISGFIGYQIWHAYYLAHLPPVEEKPDIKFGLLPALDFPKSSVSTSNFSYSLNTITGGLPKVGTDPGFEKNIKVYFLTKTFATLLSPDRSQALAEKFKVNSAPIILSETKYQFKDKDKSLLIDLDTGNFSYTKEATVSGKVTSDDSSKLTADLKQMLATLGSLNSDLQNGRNKVTNLKTTVLISLWPTAIDKKPIFTADFNKSLVNATVFGEASQLDNYLSLNFTYYPIDTSTFATYPLKGAEQAFDDLKNGKGVVVVEPDKPEVSITSVYLGYYLPESYSPYLQPIYIFEGPSFVAYVTAINEQF
ncbi:MAG: hypothetical protein Q7R82_02335 [Candidatus Daviesbacteria bacterium]|nr:hypothetical protein [Candidatus Daviesbacteria bacterium]